MSEPLKIKVNIANRSYPLTIDRKDEEQVRKAELNTQVSRVAQSKRLFPVVDTWLTAPQ